MVESLIIVRFICDRYVYTIFAILHVIIWETIKTEYYLVFCAGGSKVVGGDKDSVGLEQALADLKEPNSFFLNWQYVTFS